MEQIKCEGCGEETPGYDIVNIVRGHITSDEGHDGRMPLPIIDGREVTWEAFGRMLMTFEGWQFKMEIHDRSEEI